MMPAAPDSGLVNVFRQIRQDARSDPKPTPTADMAGINIVFDGGGQPLTVGMGGYIELPFSCRIMGARLLADVPCNATVDLLYGTFIEFPGAATIYDTIPTLVGAQTVDIDVTAWPVRRLVARDILQYALTTFSGVPIPPALTAAGTATRLTLSLWVRKTDGPSGASNVVSASGTAIVNSSGNTVSIRGG